MASCLSSSMGSVEILVCCVFDLWLDYVKLLYLESITLRYPFSIMTSPPAFEFDTHFLSVDPGTLKALTFWFLAVLMVLYIYLGIKLLSSVSICMDFVKSTDFLESFCLCTLIYCVVGASLEAYFYSSLFTHCCTKVWQINSSMSGKEVLIRMKNFLRLIAK